MTRDTDLIRRGDAIKAVTDADRDCRGAHGARENIAAIPAHPVQEPPSPGVTAGATRPERIWAWSWLTQPMGQWGVEPSQDTVEYIRADLATPAPVVPADQRAAIAALADRMWRVHPRDLSDAGYEHLERGGKYDNPRAAWYADQIEALFKQFRDQVSQVVPAEGLNALVVECVEMEDWSLGYAHPADPIWRIVINRQCADFPSETAARNFAAQIAALRSAPPVGARVSIPSGLIDALRSQRQIDADGCEVAVSRQACDEAAAILAALLPAGEGEE